MGLLFKDLPTGKKCQAAGDIILWSQIIKEREKTAQITEG